AQGRNQASKGEKQAERNEEPGVPPGEGRSSHPLEEAKPPEVDYDPAEEDGRERPRAGDEWPARKGGAPERESAQHDETRGEEEDRHQQGSRWRRLEQGLAVLLRNGHIGPPTSSA